MPAVVLAEVVAVRPLTPNAVVVTLDGPEVTRIAYSGADQRIKLLFAREGQRAPVLPSGDDWYGTFMALPEDVRPIMRTYTVRGQEPDSGRIDVEFILHGDSGPASAWAQAARPGDPLGVIAATADDDATQARPYAPGVADWQLLVGDATALPAIASILEQLPAGACARVFLQVPTPKDIRDLATPAADVEVTWLTGTHPADAVRAAEFPDGTPYAWVAGEAAMVRAVRRHLLDDRGFEPRAHYFGGYWRTGVTEDGQ
jgi:NADPH-dependent ferric siderophore reductase